nr:MAG TPA: hypothetical protein [Crassvirales sp.]
MNLKHYNHEEESYHCSLSTVLSTIINLSTIPN